MTFHLRAVVTEPKFEFVDSGCYMGYDYNPTNNTFGGKCYKDETKDVPPGDGVSAIASVKNVGTGSGKATVKIYHGTTKLCESTSLDISPGSTQYMQFSCFTMPTANRDIVMQVYYGTRLDDTVGHRVLKHKLKRAWRRMCEH